MVWLMRAYGFEQPVASQMLSPTMAGLLSPSHCDASSALQYPAGQAGTLACARGNAATTAAAATANAMRVCCIALPVCLKHTRRAGGAARRRNQGTNRNLSQVSFPQ